MDSIQFIAMFFCLALVAGWYIGNEQRGTKGAWGFLSVVDADDELAKVRSKYRVKADPKNKVHIWTARRNEEEPEPVAGSTYRIKGKGQVGRYRSKDAPGYRSRGPLPRYGDRPKRP